jgi:2-succinyl-5-enolpyruvyl-6-hydroxy-3-cyclohexene-1-carboxylate synthase
MTIHLYPNPHIFNNPSSLWSALIIDQLVKNGVTTFYCAPGMRNAPLLRAIHEHPGACAYSGFDERSQSYRALGFIRARRQPAALVCTSGTAVANFLPAVIEAQKSRIPLIVLSADRPGELNAIDANQTIDQTEVLRNYCKHYWTTSEPQSDFPPRALSGRLAHLIHSSLTGPCGPLHINIPLREPLDHSFSPMEQNWSQEIYRLLEKNGPSIEYGQFEKKVGQDELQDVFTAIEKSQRPLVTFGPMDEHGPDLLADLQYFLSHYQGSFCLDVTTGLKYFFGSEQGLIPTLDHPEVFDQLDKSNPDLIIHFGHRMTSKQYYKFLKRRIGLDPEAKIFHICESHQHEDPGLAFQRRWELNPLLALKAINQFIELKLAKGEKLSKSPLLQLQSMIEKKSKIIEEAPFCYPVMTKLAVENLNKISNVFMGNSTFIRSFDSYASYRSQEKKWNIVANRGASGIEGHLAMTQGLYEALPAPTVAFMGDVSFIHDLNSLAILSQWDKSIPLLIIVANNFGGGIFKLLPIGKEKDQEINSFLPLLTTPHQIKLTPIVKGFNLECLEIRNRDEYKKALKDWSDQPRLLLLECFFTDEDNGQTYDLLKTVKL